MRGRLERVKNGLLIGWIWDEDAPDRHVEFDLLVNGRIVGSFVAGTTRRDLRDKQIGAGDHAFRVPILRDWLQSGENSFRVVTKPDGLEVDDGLTFDPSDGTVSTGGNASAHGQAPRAVPESAENPKNAVPARPASPLIQPLPRPLPDDDDPTMVKGESLQIVLDTAASPGAGHLPTVAKAIDALFKRQLWREVEIVARHARQQIWDTPEVLTQYGRALLYSGDVDAATAVLERLNEIAPHRHTDVFYLGAAYSRKRRWHEALEVFVSCTAADASHAKYHYEAGRALMNLGFGGFGLFPEDRPALERAVECFERALAIDDRDWRWFRELAAVLLSLGRTDDAYECARMAIAKNPEAAGPYTEFAKVSLRANRIAEALGAAQRAAELDPSSDGVKFNLRFIARLAETASPNRPVSIGSIRREAAVGEVLFDPNTESEWVVLDGADTSESRSLVERFGFTWAAGIRMTSDAPPFVWRADYLRALLACGAVPADLGAAEVAARAEPFGQFVTVEPEARPYLSPARRDRRTVLLLSQYGIRKFGGGEHFLQQMAHLYKQLGYDVLVVGTQSESEGEYGERDGLRYVYVDRNPDAILRLALDERAALVHVISGLVFEATASLRWFDIRVIHGIHSWRDVFVPPTPSNGYFPDVDRGATPRPEFEAAVQDCAAIYVNAAYTREEVERAFNFRAPVVYSLPDDVEQATGGVTHDREYVLLVNTRSDKGLDFLLDVAALLPRVPFVAISSQSSKEAAEAAVRARGLPNVEILDRVDDVSPLYERARVVAVPSYRFIETFSRVVIEAQRFGVPVIGSNRGNVPYLLEQSGISLPEDPSVWAKEVERLVTDDQEWARRSAQALENSERYSFRQQSGALSGVVSGVESPLLVGVGSGLGNIIHTTPLIRNLSRRLGRRVDVVVAGDHSDLLFVPTHPDYVNHAFGLTDSVMHRRYDTVFLTHSFGALIPKFASTNILLSRSWDHFGAAHRLHEAEFNLAAAQALLGVDYEPADIAGYYVGDLSYELPEEPLVGLHAGSKGGIWGSKRWPHFAELARRLTQGGIPVASFGTSDEYVPGTIDMTGGSIREMALRMRACSHFVSNDSGVMNIANALGIPLTALFAPTNARTRGPISPTSRSISIERQCSPCEIREPYRRTKFLAGTCACIDDIDVNVVQRAVLEAIEASEPTRV